MARRTAFWIGAALAVAGLVPAGAAGLPQGTFAGTATWLGPDRSTGSYEVEKTISGNTVSARYAWTDTGRREESHSVTFDIEPARPTFDVLDARAEVVGSGFCLEDACSYRVTLGPVTIAETMQWTADRMTVIGSKAGPGFAIVWKEQLDQR